MSEQQNTQQPVLFYSPNSRELIEQRHQDGYANKVICSTARTNEFSESLYTAPARDVLMAFGEELFDKIADNVDRWITGDYAPNGLSEYVATIADRYASRVQPERCQCCGYLVTQSEHKGCLRAGRSATQPEPVNQQMLAALKQAKNSLLAFKLMPGQSNAWEEHDEENLVAINAAIAAAEAAQPVALEPVEGDLLPAIGEEVLIHLASSDKWVPHRVVGYYAWCDRGGNKSLHRVFVRVVDRDGYQNARLLCDVRRTGEGRTQQPASAQPVTQQADHIVDSDKMVQAEPVAAQCRFEDEEEWNPCTLAHHLLVQAHPKEWPHYETRVLYAHPPAVAVPDAMQQIAHDAATSLETISRIAGKDGHYMETMHDVRMYAAARAKVARDDMLSAAKPDGV